MHQVGELGNLLLSHLEDAPRHLSDGRIEADVKRL